MNYRVITFPSVYETAYGNTENSAKDLLHGLKITKDNNWYLVGDMARRNSVNAGRVINAAPDEEDFDILLRAAMVNVIDKIEKPFSITVGFPLSTFNIYKVSAEQFLGKSHFLLEYDTTTFNINGGIKKSTFDINTYEVIPELVGGIIGLKKVIPQAKEENFIAISFGFGTIEGGYVTRNGLVNRTCFSSHGLRYVVNNLARELNKKYYLEMKNEHQMDEAFMKGSIFSKRKQIDFTEIKQGLLTHYYKEVVAPLMRQYFTDNDFEECSKIYLLGGGAYYDRLVEAMTGEFKDFIPVVVAPEPETIVSIGYLHNSLRISDSNPFRCIGLDMGNATTKVSIFEK
jgi:plasmid segregation protein ParM